jgi:hypothetical protein
MTRKDLIEIGKRIQEAEGTESELAGLLVMFNENVPYPDGANLFIYPEDYNARKDNLNQYRPSVESVVDKCLAYKGPQIL